MRFTSRLPAALLGLLVIGAQAETATITVSSNNTPLDRKVLQELSSEAFRRIGVDFKLVSLPSERSLQAADAGEVDGEGLRVAGLNSQYPNLLQVPERYIRVSFVAFKHKDKAHAVDHGWEGLRSYSVAFITGWKMFENNTTSARLVTKVNKPEQMFRMVDSGRVDLALYTHADGVALARNLGLDSIVPLSPALKDVDMYLYLNKRHERLIPKLAQALRAMKADGTYERILAASYAE